MKRILRVFLIVFTLLFVNLLSINVSSIKAEEPEITLDLTNAYRGEIRNYWALVNYGNNFVGSDTITIFLDPEAISNPDVKYIMMSEVDSYGDIQSTYYERGIDSGFASSFTYTFVTGGYGEKNFTIFLLSDLYTIPFSIIDRIDINDIEKLRTIDGLNRVDFDIYSDEYDIYARGSSVVWTNSPYKVYVDIKNNSCEYKLKNVAYSYWHTNGDGSKTLVKANAIKDVSGGDCNKFYFVVNENSEYSITVEDYFDVTKPLEGETWKIEIVNFLDSTVNLVVDYDKSLTNTSVTLHVSVYDGLGRDYPAHLILELTVTDPSGNVTDIKNLYSYDVLENGVYRIDCKTNPVITFLDVNINNIDKTRPTVYMANQINITSSSVESIPYSFNPESYVLATDDMTNGDDIVKIMNYYKMPSGGSCEYLDESHRLTSGVYNYLYSVNEVCVVVEVFDEAGNNNFASSIITVTDDTIPTITSSVPGIELEIGDHMPTDEELVDLFSITTNDNSQINNPERVVTVVGDLSNVNLHELGVYRAYIYCYDESGNQSRVLSLTVVVTRRILVVDAVANQYIVYGEEMITIKYTCNGNPCINTEDPDNSEILPADWNKFTGELYIAAGSIYAGEYPIYSTLTINSNKYYIDLNNLGVFTIKPRTFKIIAHSYSIDYKDSEPILTWYMDTSVCGPGLSTNYTSFNEMNYSCTFVEGDKFSDNTYVYRVVNGTPIYAGGIAREVGDTVKYSSGEVTYYKITKGELSVKEFTSGGKVNYEIDFYGRDDILTVVEPDDWNENYDKYYYLNESENYVALDSPTVWEENKYFYKDEKTGSNIGTITSDMAKFYIYPKYVEITFSNVSKIYGEDDPSHNYVDENKGLIKDDGKGHVQYNFTCFSYKEPIKSMCNEGTPTYSLSALQIELGVKISREDGENVGRYKIIGTYTNDNYEVFFNEEFSPEYNRIPAAPAYLNIIKRNIEMSIEGEDNNGKYTIFYEDALPVVTVRIDNDPNILHEGLASNTYLNINDGALITFADRLNYGAHRVSYYDGATKMEVIIGGYEEYITGVGTFAIKRDTMTILNVDDVDVWDNYEVIFHEGTLEVLARQIYIKIVEGLNKIYGDEDPSYVAGYGAENGYVVDGSGHYVLQIINTLDNTTIVDRPGYVPFDKDKLSYYLKRSRDSVGVDEGDVHEGEMVGSYLVSEDHYVNDTNYIIDIYEEYYFRISKRNISVSINDADIEFNYDNLVPKFSYGFSNLAFSDVLIGQPSVAGVAGYRNNGKYSIVLGDITPISSEPSISDDGEYWFINGYSTDIKLSDLTLLDKSLLKFNNGKYSVYNVSDNTYISTDIDFEEYSVNDNYVISYSAGTLTVVPREVVIIPTSGLSKQYADYDPEFTYVVVHYNNYLNGINAEEIIRDPTDFEGELDRASGEKPGVYAVVQNTLRPAIKIGPNSPYDRNFIIMGYDASVTFTIEKRELVLKLAVADEDNKVEVFYGESEFNRGFKIVSGSEGYNPELCTMETISGVETCDQIYDKIAGDVSTYPANPENVGSYRIFNDSLYMERVISGINVLEYYELTFIEATLIIKEREIFITPREGQTKIYGEGGGGDCDITYSYHPHIIKPTIELFSGCLKREPKLNPEGVLTTEEVGEYLITLGGLKINDNYKLTMNGSVTYQILPRSITITAKVTGDNVTKSGSLNIYTMMYGDEYELGYDISGMGLVSNAGLGIYDSMINNVELYSFYEGVWTNAYHGVGTYSVVRGSLAVANNKGRNYNITFEKATFDVTKRIINVKPIESTKVYGEDDPEVYEFILTGEVAPYTGGLSRIPGESARKYKITEGDLNFGENYQIVLEDANFEILKREVIVTADNKEKLFAHDDPELTYSVEVQDNFVLDTPWIGKLERTPGEDVGVYDIIQGELRLNTNYNIIYNGATLTIRYSRFEYIVINNITQNQYQTQGDERLVKLEARFNKGADESGLKDVTWSIVKDGKNVSFQKDISNIVSFTPAGTAGVYVVRASYNGVSANYEVYVLPNNVKNVHISFFEGSDNQKLGAETEVVYKADIELLNEDYNNVNIEWFVGMNRVCSAAVTSKTNYCRFKPNVDVAMTVGTYNVYAVIGNVNSNVLVFKLNDNLTPAITLVDQGVIYYIEAFQNATADSSEYIEPGFEARDDIDGNITANVKIEGDKDINYYKTGTYTIIYTVVDSHGHVASNYRTVIVRDTVKPVITLQYPELKNIILEYGEEYVEYDATAYDAYDSYYGYELTKHVDNQVDVTKVGKYIVRYYFSDSNGNAAEEIRNVTIQDTVKPTIELIGNTTIYIEYKATFRDDGAWFDDNYDPRIKVYATTIEYVNPDTLETMEVSSVDTSVLGTYRLTYYKEDSSGNPPESAPIRTVVVRDSTPPVITLLGTNPYQLKYGTTYVEPGYKVIDNYDGDITDNEALVSVRAVIGDTLGEYYVYYNAKDTHNNHSEEVIRVVKLVDLVSPMIHFTEACPQYVYIEALYETYDMKCNTPGINNGFYVTDDYVPDIDSIQGWVKIRGTAEVDTTTVGVYPITYDVSDRGGNASSTLTRYVVVRDKTKPTLTLNPNESGEIDFYVEVFNQYVEYGATASDRYDDHHGLEIKIDIREAVDINKLNTYTVEYIATDSNGNESDPVYRFITVRDTTPPEIIITGDLEVIVERGTPYDDPGAYARDNYDDIDQLVVFKETEVPTGMNYGKFEIRYCAYDSSYNKGCASRIVNVVDTIAPTVEGVKNGEYYNRPFYIYYAPLTGTDEVLTGWLNGQLITAPWQVTKEASYELEVKDDAGNTTRIEFTLDMTPPVILGTNDREYINYDVDIHSDEVLKSITYRYGNGGYVTENIQSKLLTEEGEYWVYATDMAGNVSETKRFIIDKTAPEYVLLGVENGGITNTDVSLVTENDVIVSVNGEYIATSQRFIENGYYKVTIRDKAGNDVFLQFVINNRNPVSISNQNIKFISQNNVIGKFVAPGDSSYPRGTGFIYAKPQLDGTFTYISGTLFSDEEYSKLINGESLTFESPYVGEEEMAVAFIVTLDELNKFKTQTVEGDNDSTVVYAFVAIGIAALGGGFFYFFVTTKRKKEEEEEVEEEEVVEDDYY